MHPASNEAHRASRERTTGHEATMGSRRPRCVTAPALPAALWPDVGDLYIYIYRDVFHIGVWLPWVVGWAAGRVVSDRCAKSWLGASTQSLHTVVSDAPFPPTARVTRHNTRGTTHTTRGTMNDVRCPRYAATLLRCDRPRWHLLDLQFPSHIYMYIYIYLYTYIYIYTHTYTHIYTQCCLTSVATRLEQASASSCRTPC